MKSIDISVTARKDFGKKHSRALRLKNQVPCVLYGGKENIHFFADERIFKNIIYTHDVYLINLNIDGEKRQVIMKEVQFHPVTDALLHIDFQEVSAERPAVVLLPVNLTGSSVGVLEGGKMRQRKRYVRVKGLISDLPDYLQIDISNLNIGQSVLAGDISIDKVEMLEPKRAAIVSVISSRAAARGMGEEPVEAAVAAPGEAAAEPGEAAAEPGEAAPALEKPEKPEKGKK
ncbi:MAG: 50S ribosomal protein L25 [Bacteroidales bacterium]|nr:50S ribosomal protein L25 [Bacteroidales bacterium]